LSIGKEGPLIHISSCLANLFLSRGLFTRLNNNQELRLQILTAACASGVACNFGAPIGGVLFGIEVTAMYYSTRSYWKCFYVAIVGALFFKWLLYITSQSSDALWQTKFDPAPYDITEVVFYLLFGGLTGERGRGEGRREGGERGSV
jgi:chloride channel 2